MQHAGESDASHWPLMWAMAGLGMSQVDHVHETMHSSGIPHEFTSLAQTNLVDSQLRDAEACEANVRLTGRALSGM